MKIEVTQHHIDNGIRFNACLCPIARAIMAATWMNEARVDYTTATTTKRFVDKEPVRTHYLLPQEAQMFVVEYDENLGVVPFEFELVEVVG